MSGKRPRPASAEEAARADISEADFYKEKLIKLARAHAALLILARNEDGVSAGDDDGEAALLSHSQLSVLSDNEDGNEIGLGKTEGNFTPPMPSGPDSDASGRSGDKLGMDGLRAENKAFSDLIADSGDVLGSIPELKPWLYWYNNVGGKEEGTGSQALPTSSGVAKETDKEQSAKPKLDKTHVRVGVGVLVKDPRNPHKVFAGKRKGSHGAGSLALPGGHLEMYETWADCAAREVEEEMGVGIQNVKFAHVTNDPMQSEGKHYITIFMATELSDPTALPRNCEPHKCEGWESYSWSDLQEIHQRGGEEKSVRLFGPLRQLVEEEPERVKEFLS